VVGTAAPAMVLASWPLIGDKENMGIIVNLRS